MVCDNLSRLSRLGMSWEALVGRGGSLLSQLEKKIPVAVFLVGDGAVRLTFGGAARPSGNLTLQADAPQSDLPGGIASALAQMNGQNVQAIVLFSDGRQVGGDKAMSAALAASGVPVFTVSAASPAVRDLAIDEIQVPSAVFVNEPLPLRVMVRA